VIRGLKAIQLLVETDGRKVAIYEITAKRKWDVDLNALYCPSTVAQALKNALAWYFKKRKRG